jgi:hypothetical protein
MLENPSESVPKPLPTTTHIQIPTSMKRTLLAASLVLGVASIGTADEAIKSAMKNYHKGEEALCKKVGAGEASSSELASILKGYEAMAKATPPKGATTSWATKTQALIDAVKGLQKGDASSKGKYKLAVNCKACHDIHKAK